MTFGCRLTLDASKPYPCADVSGSVIHLAPTKAGNLVRTIDQSGNIRTSAITGLSFDVSSVAASPMNDLYLIEISTEPVIVRVPWTGTPLAPASADADIDGTAVNASSVTAYREDGSSLTVAAERGVYIGSYKPIGTTGVIRCDVSYAESRIWGLWNYYNQAEITLRVGEPTRCSRALTNTTWQPLFGNGGNASNVVTGRKTPVSIAYHQAAWRQCEADTPAIGQIGIGWCSTSAPSGFLGQWDTEGNSSKIAIGSTEHAYLYVPDALGMNTATMLNKMISIGGALPGVNSCMFFGNTENDQLMTVRYQG